MNENIIKMICSEMNQYLNNYQMSKLNEALYKRLDSIEDINFENKSCIVFGKGKK